MSKAFAGIVGLTSVVSLIAARLFKPRELMVGDIVTDGVTVGAITTIDDDGLYFEPLRTAFHCPPEGIYNLRRASRDEIKNACEHGSLKEVFCANCASRDRLAQLEADIAMLAKEGCRVEIRRGVRTVIIPRRRRFDFDIPF